ncbi:MAG: adenylate/guanylate cyclase domain-containing protein, partial [Jiangellaceae bacterium]
MVERFVYSRRMLVASGLVLALPLVGLVLLLRRPSLDVVWQHHPSHFWLVLATAVLSAILAYATGVVAQRRGDARVMLVSLTFLASAGYLGLHALATPGVLLDAPNRGFVVATPLGIAIGSVFALLSSLPLSGPDAVTWVKRGRRLRVLLLASMVVWAIWSLSGLPPLDQGLPPERAAGTLAFFAVPAIGLYAVAGFRYVRLWQRRPSLMVLSMLSAFVLLAEAMVAIVFARNWHLSWWEWHVLMLAAFGLVALGARMQWHEERFTDLYLPRTVAGERDMSVLFADLQGFTTFSENHAPTEVTAMLNAYFNVAVPAVVSRYDGEVNKIIGDALMVTWNRLGDQLDHASRAAGAGLALQEATASVAAAHPDWPRFRVGINSGPVSVSVLGTEGGR